MTPDDEQVNRRSFFRAGLRELLKPLADAVEPLHRAVDEIARMESAAAKRAPLLFLRPPGALPEQSFTDTCSRCGECVKVCPAQCIQIDETKLKGRGAPYIDPNAMPCVMCDGLKCMFVCPTGALVPTALADIDMGTAEWNEQLCVRSNGEDCTICVDRCPIGSVAIELKDAKIHVIEQGCTGCGVCQHDCPTSPKSIVVVPR